MTGLLNFVFFLFTDLGTTIMVSSFKVMIHFYMSIKASFTFGIKTHELVKGRFTEVQVYPIQSNLYIKGTENMPFMSSCPLYTIKIILIIH